MLKHNVKYLCYFDDWDVFMDGDIIIGKLKFHYDFVAEKTEPPGDFDHILTPFTEEAARQHFADKGLEGIEFVYGKI